MALEFEGAEHSCISVMLGMTREQCETPVRLMGTSGDVLMKSGRIAIAELCSPGCWIGGALSQELSDSLLTNVEHARRSCQKKSRAPYDWRFFYSEEERDDRKNIGFAEIGRRIRARLCAT